MVITQVYGHVPPAKWEDLRAGYRSLAAVLEPQIAETFLLQDVGDPTHWRVATVWRSREALDEYRRSVETPGAFVLFRNVGVEPQRSVFDVVDHAANV